MEAGEEIDEVVPKYLLSIYHNGWNNKVFYYNKHLYNVQLLTREKWVLISLILLYNLMQKQMH